MRLCAVVENVSSYNVRCVSLQGRCQVTWNGGDFEESGIEDQIVFMITIRFWETAHLPLPYANILP